MVSMIPQKIGISNPVSEKEVFRALELIRNRPDWIVIHSLKQARSIKNLSAETDFVVIVPGQGIVLIEAKGATAVKIDGNSWTMEGVPEDAKHKDPLSQLDGASANVRRYLLKQKLIGNSLPITRLVWFNKLAEGNIDDSKKDRGMELFPWEIAWLEDLEDAQSIIERNLRSYAKAHPIFRGEKVEASSLTSSLAREIASALRVDIEVSSDKASQAKAREVQIKQATKEQLRCLSLVSSNPFIYFEGGAGSGKTQLVIESALNLAEQGKMVLLTAWNKMMAERLEKRFEGVPNVHVEDVGSVLAGIARQERPAEVSKDEWYDSELAKLASKEIAQHPALASFDAICVDEFQDIAGKPDVCKALFSLVKDGASPTIVLAGDDEQQIMATASKVNAFQSAQVLNANFFRVTLNANCRQAPELSGAIHDFLGMDASRISHLVPLGGEHSFEVMATSDENQLKDLARLINRLLERFEGRNIRVLSPFGAKRSTLALLFATPREEIHSKEVKKLMPLLRHETSPEGKITWRSISSFKGLEEDVIVLVDINNDAKAWLEGEGKNLREQLYVGMTRAKFHLYMLVSDGLYEANTNY
jgi:hypothetical protein